jgi:glycerol-3-phosphate acyltransferase PlsY
MIGHLYPVWLKFHGGKGVATFLGILIPLLWQAAVIYALVWLGLLLTTRISSIAGMGARHHRTHHRFRLEGRCAFPLLLGFALLIIGSTAKISFASGKEPSHA